MNPELDHNDEPLPESTSSLPPDAISRYIKPSLILHGLALLTLLVVTQCSSQQSQRSDETLRLTLISSPVDDPVEPDTEPTPVLRTPKPVATPEPTATPQQTATPEPERPDPEPRETIVVRRATPTPTPTPTPRPTPRPSPTASPSPRPTLRPTPSPTPRQTPRPSPTATRRPSTPRPTVSPSPTRARTTPTITPRPQPTATRRPATPYDVEGSTQAGESAIGSATGTNTGSGQGAALRLDAAPGSGGLPAAYAQRARLRIQQAFVVPPELAVEGLKTTLSWQILPDGFLADITVEKSSGRADLDALAADSLRRVSNLGTLPPGLPAAGVRVTLDFEFGASQ